MLRMKTSQVRGIAMLYERAKCPSILKICGAMSVMLMLNNKLKSLVNPSSRRSLKMTRKVISIDPIRKKLRIPILYGLIRGK